MWLAWVDVCVGWEGGRGGKKGKRREGGRGGKKGREGAGGGKESN